MRIVTVAGRRVRHAVKMQSVLLANSIALTFGALATAVLGFLFWWFAARSFSPHAVGLASAAISIMNLIALVGECGLGTLLIGEALRTKDAPGLVSAALVSAFVSSSLFGAACIALIIYSPFELGNFFEDRNNISLFIAGCAISGFTIVLDSAFAGLLRSSVAMCRNIAFSVLKLVLLVLVAALAFGSGQEIIIFLAWVLGKLLSVLLLVVVLIGRGQPVLRLPSFGVLRSLAPHVLAHHLLNLATQGPGLILPFIVTVMLSADVNAAFFAAWMILSVVLLIPASLTTTLFTIGSVEPSTIAARMRFSLGFCALTSVCAGISLLLLSDVVLGIFGASYASVGGPVLQILGASVFAVTVKYHYIAIQRLKGRMARASVLLGIGGMVELILAIAGGRLEGINGFASGWVAAMYLEAIFMLPALVRAARRVDDDLKPGIAAQWGASEQTGMKETLRANRVRRLAKF